MSSSSARAFTLVEIMIVVVIIGLLAAVAIPAFQKSRTNSLATRVANDVKKVAEDFTVMLFENPGMPSGVYNEGGVGNVPAGFNTADLPPSILKRPINQNTVLSVDVRAGLASANTAVVVITPVGGYTLPTDVLTRVDAILDDGSLASGEMRRPGGQLIYTFHRD